MITQQPYRYIALLLCLLGACFVLPRIASAATVSLTTAATDIRVGDTFTVDVNIDSTEEAINALAAYIHFPPEVLELITVKSQNSILTVWPHDPSGSQTLGQVQFIGGLPDPGFMASGGHIGSLVFKAKAVATATVGFSANTEILKNDGLGSKATVSALDLTLQSKSATPGRAPGVITEEPDTTAPINLTLLISKSEIEFEGKYFAAFTAQDTGSGIHHFEIAEKVLKNKNDFPAAYPNTADWKPAKSPYVLENQSGNVAVFVKAVDNAKNATVESALLQTQLPIHKSYRLIVLLMIILIISLVLLGYRKNSIKKPTAIS